MHRTGLLCLVVGLATTIIALGRIGHVQEPGSSKPKAVAPEAQATAQPPLSPPTPSGKTDDRALTIVELRQEMGGSLLQGTLLGEPEEPEILETDFLRALESQLAEEHTARTTARCEDRYQQLLAEPNGLDHASTEAESLPRRMDPAQLSSYADQQTPPDLAAVLRAAGRQLDTHANDLEDAGDYDQSDELRRLARRIRKVARKYRGPSGTPEVAEEQLLELR